MELPGRSTTIWDATVLPITATTGPWVQGRAWEILTLTFSPVGTLVDGYTNTMLDVTFAPLLG
jgi:hypothetical protein